MKIKENKSALCVIFCVLSVILTALVCSCSLETKPSPKPPTTVQTTQSDLQSSSDAMRTEPPVTTKAQTVTTASPVVTSVPITTPITTQPTPTYVYEGAIEDFLLPVEEFSWERIHAPEFVMLHFTSAVVNHRDDPYNMDHIRQIFIDYDVSVHYIIERNGTIRCYIPEDRVAWHAGKGEFGDAKYTNSMNQYAIGIEIVGMGSKNDMSGYLTAKEYDKIDDSLKGFTDEQYDALFKLVDDICKRYSIPKDRDHVIGHEDYSSGKTDPGELFLWDRVLN